MDDFNEELEKISRAAFSYGIQTIQLRKWPNSFQSRAEYTKFIGACHRGYEKAQRSVIAALAKNAEDPALTDSERKRREFVLRKVIDALIFLMLEGKVHVIRRLALHGKAQSLNFKELDRALESAEKMNAESRLTFAALADLSTYVHFCDIVRIDCRKHPRRTEFIELKEGAVNVKLGEALEKYPVVPESLPKLEEDESIDPKYLKQAKRMLTQKIRVEQVKEVIKTDKGIDIALNAPIQLIETNADGEYYSKYFNECCKRALDTGIGVQTVNYCLHFGMVRDADPQSQDRIARVGAVMGMAESMMMCGPELKPFYEANKADQRLHAKSFPLINVINANLFSMAVIPFYCWNIENRAKDAIAQGKLSIYCMFDLPAMLYLIQKAGLKVRVSSRGEGMEDIRRMGKQNVITFDDRVVKISNPTLPGEITLLSGAFSRFINNLHSPYQYFISTFRTWKEGVKDLAGEDEPPA